MTTEFNILDEANANRDFPVWRNSAGKVSDRNISLILPYDDKKTILALYDRKLIMEWVFFSLNIHFQKWKKEIIEEIEKGNFPKYREDVEELIVREDSTKMKELFLFQKRINDEIVNCGFTNRFPKQEMKRAWGHTKLRIAQMLCNSYELPNYKFTISENKFIIILSTVFDHSGGWSRVRGCYPPVSKKEQVCGGEIVEEGENYYVVKHIIAL